MKITKQRLKQIIVEELEAVMNEEEEEEQVEEGFISSDAVRGPERRVPASVELGRQRRDRQLRGDEDIPGGAEDSSFLKQLSTAVGMEPSAVMLKLAQEMGVDIAGQGEEPPLPIPPEGE